MPEISLLRNKYPEFLYKKYSYDIIGDNLEIYFDFSIEPGILFKPSVVVKNVSRSRINKIKKEVIDNLIFHLGLIEMLSYWKCTCSPKIRIEAGSLDKNQTKWWKDLIIKGMGQFFYENKIDWRKPNFVKIETQNRNKAFLHKEILRNRVLIPVGGGKDSPVTIEILKKSKKQIGCFSLNPTPAARQIIKIAGCKKPIIVERKIDPKLLELNQKGFLNGHTPFSAYLAFLSVLLAIIFDYKYIAFSNERSSNEGNLKYLGEIINHQYSKSFEFEKKFSDYCSKYLTQNYSTPGVEYFSFLRPLYEIQISRIFSKYPKYFSAFLSCNEAFKTYSGRKKPLSKWCGNCPKCLFVFASLYPFLNRIKIRKIFGENLFRKVSLMPLMEQLIGEKKFKPFECVGTRKESLVAFYLGWKKDKRRSNMPFLLKHFEKKILPKHKNLEAESMKILNAWDPENNLPKSFERVLKKSISGFRSRA